MASTNFKVFNEEMSSDRTFSDSEYEVATQRQIGVIPGMALSRLHNKMYRQSSAIAKAVADFLVSQGLDCMDNNIPGITTGIESAILKVAGDGIDAHNSDTTAHEDIREALSNGGLNLLKRNKTYVIGDIAYSANLPSWARLECVVGGTTASIEPTWGATTGILIVDGALTWIIDDMRDCTPVGRPVHDLLLRTGYIKANGATVNRADYPRLVKFITDNNLWTSDTTSNPGFFGTGDGSTTMVMPNLVGLFMQGSSAAGTKVTAGLPNITGSVSNLGSPNNSSSDGSGSMRRNYYGSSGYGGSGGNYMSNLSFNASLSNSIYGNSTTVQPPAVTMIPQIKY